MENNEYLRYVIDNKNQYSDQKGDTNYLHEFEKALFLISLVVSFALIPVFYKRSFKVLEEVLLNKSCCISTLKIIKFTRWNLKLQMLFNCFHLTMILLAWIDKDVFKALYMF